MRKKPKSIRLNRETLRALDPRELGRVAAAFSLAPCDPCTNPVTRCGDQCATYSCGEYLCD